MKNEVAALKSDKEKITYLFDKIEDLIVGFESRQNSQKVMTQLQAPIIALAEIRKKVKKTVMDLLEKKIEVSTTKENDIELRNNTLNSLDENSKKIETLEQTMVLMLETIGNMDKKLNNVFSNQQTIAENQKQANEIQKENTVILEDISKKKDKQPVMIPASYASIANPKKTLGTNSWHTIQPKNRAKAVETISQLSARDAENVIIKKKNDGFVISGPIEQVQKVTQHLQEQTEVVVKERGKIAPYLEIFDETIKRSFDDFWRALEESNPGLPGLNETRFIRTATHNESNCHVIQVSSNVYKFLSEMKEKGMPLRTGLWYHNWQIALARPQCQHCYSFDHGTSRHAQFSSVRTCRFCAEAYTEGHKCTVRKCANCSESGHCPNQRKCPKFRERLEKAEQEYDLTSGSTIVMQKFSRFAKKPDSEAMQTDERPQNTQTPANATETPLNSSLTVTVNKNNKRLRDSEDSESETLSTKSAKGL